MKFDDIIDLYQYRAERQNETYHDTWSSLRPIPSETVSLKEIEKNLSVADKRFILRLAQAESEQKYLWNLEQSIKKTGMKTPMQIERTAKGWELPEGNHRFIVAKRLGLETVPVSFV